ncbi:hypothetical protein ACE3MZ_16565 [Paenibacillus sp. WLX1005]|uniref:hypothetical protein n=1 Tax=Paenibacillus sp. WLX1005 TaxID=3243766 RepID=UPI00398439AD
MKREVAEEWMSRYLDGDLGAEDSKALFRYIDENPDAAETFRIMTALSLRLEKLPDVKPKYSLVDAILPQLDQLDAERRSESATEIGIMEPQQDEQDELAQRRRQRGNWRDRLPVRTIGGIVAAGVVLGISIASYEPKTLTDAGSPASPYSYNQENATEENGSVSNPEKKEPSVDSINKEEDQKQADKQKEPSNATDTGSSSNEPSDGQTSTKTPSTSDTTKNKENNTNTTPPSSESTGNHSQSQEPSTDKRGGVPSTGNTDSSSTTKSNSNDKSTEQQETATPSTSTDQWNSSSGKTDSSTSGGTDSTSTDPEASGTDEEAGILSTPEAQPSLVAPDTGSTSTGTTDSPSTNSSSGTTGTQGSDTTSTNSAGITMPKTEQEWKSPTEDYTVVLTTQNTLRLDSIAADNVNGRSVVSSIPLKGTWISGKWSDDGKVFTYQVNENNISKTYKITVGN